MKANSEHIDQLISDCKKGNKQAQFALYKMYCKGMYNVAFRILNDSFEAEDAMQEAFLNCFTKMESYKGEVAFGAWLKKIVINKSLTNLKKNESRKTTGIESVAYKLADEEEKDMGIGSDEKNEKVKLIIDAIQSLKENYRVILNLSLFEGYDNEEIAEIMGISDENCRTTLSRAKSKLRSMLSSPSFANGST